MVTEQSVAEVAVGRGHAETHFWLSTRRLTRRLSYENSPTISLVRVGVVAWFLPLLSLTACSEEPERPDRGQIDARTAVAEGTAGREPAPGEDVDSVPVEYTVDGVLLRREEGVLNIEEATLRGTERGDEPEVIVRAALEVPADYEKCLLMRESTWRDLQQSLGDDDVPGTQVFEHPWGRRTVREEFRIGNEIVVIFSQSPNTDAEIADVRGLALYSFCYTKVVASSAGAQRTTWYDVSRVEETPVPPPEP